MKSLLLTFTLILTTAPVYSQELYIININKICAELVGIPYASDNFTDEEWEQFKTCLRYMKENSK